MAEGISVVCCGMTFTRLPTTEVVGGAEHDSWQYCGANLQGNTVKVRYQRLTFCPKCKKTLSVEYKVFKVTPEMAQFGGYEWN